LTLILRPLRFWAHYPDLIAARDVGDVARDRQAPLEVAVVTARAHDLGVDQLVQLALDLHHAGLKSHAELRRREPHTRCCTHRLGEVVKQLVQVLAEGIDRLPLEPQPRVAEGDDRENAHWRRV